MRKSCGLQMSRRWCPRLGDLYRQTEMDIGLAAYLPRYLGRLGENGATAVNWQLPRQERQYPGPGRPISICIAFFIPSFLAVE